MKTLIIKRPHEIAVNDHSTDIAGTQLVDAIDISYGELIEKLGPPLPGSPDGKVRAQWTIEDTVTGEVATIYDWSYLIGYVEQLHDWNIGGHNRNAITLVRQVLG